MANSPTVSAQPLGARIRQARKIAGLSQSQLANRIGAHFTSVSDWERSKNQPSARHLISLARETGQPLSFFGADEDDEEAALKMPSLDEFLRLRVLEIMRQEAVRA